MRVALGHLARDPLGDLFDSKPPALLCQARQEEHLEEQVAELLPQFLRLPGVHGREYLVGLLEEVGPEGLEGLLRPGAVPAQPRDEGRRRRCCCSTGSVGLAVNGVHRPLVG